MTRTIVIRIELPDGVEAPQIDYHDEPPHPAADYAPAHSGSHPAVVPPVTSKTCQHGLRVFKEGVNKAGKPYKGFFCAEDQCAPEWVSTR